MRQERPTVADVLGLIALRGSGRDERKEQNEKVRALLWRLSNRDICQLTFLHRHDLSFREWRKRAVRPEKWTTEEVFACLALWLDTMPGIVGGRRKWGIVMHGLLWGVLPYAPQKEVIDQLNKYNGHRMFRDVRMIETILWYGRDDHTKVLHMLAPNHLLHRV